jgi:hypothetical protein
MTAIKNRNRQEENVRGGENVRSVNKRETVKKLFAIGSRASKLTESDHTNNSSL